MSIHVNLTERLHVLVSYYHSWLGMAVELFFLLFISYPATDK